MTRYRTIVADPPWDHSDGTGWNPGTRDHRLTDEQRSRAPEPRLTGLPYVIENVPAARSEMREPITLCGSSFGLAVRRHRLFETTFPVLVPPCAHHLQAEAKYWTSWRPNGEERRAKVVQVYGNAAEQREWPYAMGIFWMSYDELAEAIPPAYTEHIGGYLMAEIKAKVVA